MKTKICKICGKQFTTTTKSIYCSDECRAQGVKQQKSEYHAKWIRQNRDHNSEYMRQYYQNDQHHSKHLARCKANNQVYSGKKPKATKCQHPRCKETANLEQHHICYDGLGALATVTLCTKHHKELHAAERKAKKQIKCTVSCKVVNL